MLSNLLQLFTSGTRHLNSCANAHSIHSEYNYVVLLVIVMVSVDQQITVKVAMQTVLSLNEAWALAIAVYTKLQ